MLSRASAAAEVMEHLINHSAHGYSQPHRAGDGTVETITLSDGERVKLHGGDYDCSESVRMCYAAVGVLPWSYTESYMWTGNERSVLLGHGFVEIPVREAALMKRGDVLLRNGHTEMYLGNNRQGGARIDEVGGINGPRKGDQTGAEVAAGTYTPSRWLWAFRYNDGKKESELNTMTCIIAIKGHSELVWFDGQSINDLSHTGDVTVLEKIYKACNDKTMPRVELTEEQFARLCQSIKGGYPRTLKKLVEKYPTRSPE